MRKIRYIAAVVLVIFILTLTFPSTPVFAADPDMRYGREKLGEMSNSASLQYVYDQLVIGCNNAQEEIRIDISDRGIDLNRDLSVIYDLFYSDYPEYFWVNGSWSASVSQRGSTITLTIKPVYTMTGSTLQSARSAYDAKVNALTADLSGSDYDKAKTLHDRLIDTVTYTSTANDQNAYGALVEGAAVCNGYARAYQHLLIKAGIPAWYVRGTSLNPTTNMPIGHAWNLVKLDGQWYYTDVTWDDQGTNTFYAYFNIPTQRLLEDHVISAEYAAWVPNATATSENYYIKEGRTFASYDQEKLVALLKKDGNKTQVYVEGDVDSFLSAVYDNLKSIAAGLGATGSYSVSCSSTQLGRAVILDVVIIQQGHSHAAQKTVAQVNASCLANGTKAYYICDCGLKFLDQACTQQITSDSQLEIKATEHTPSGWQKDVTDHWKACTVCGSETADTRSAHSDNNQDNRCDICGYALPKTDTGSTPADKETTGGNNSSTEQTIDQSGGNENNDATDSGNDKNEDPTDNSTQGGTVAEGTEDTGRTESTGSADDVTTESTDGTDPVSTTAATGNATVPSTEADYPNTAEGDRGGLIRILIGGAAIVVAAGAMTTVLVIHKKRSKQ